MAKIPGGYILKARRALQSELMDKPPLWSKLWDWLLLRAEWREGARLKRGQLLTTIEEMREAMSWHVGYRKVLPSREEIRAAYRYFSTPHENTYEAHTNPTMTTITKTTRGLLITITNYDKYQDPKNYEAHTETHFENCTKPTTTPYDSKELEEIRSKKEVKPPLTPQRGDGARTKARSTNSPCPLGRIVDAYHSILPSLPAATRTPDLEKRLRARWRENPERQSLDWWKSFFQRVAASDFLTGRAKDFTANLHWLVGPQNMTKVENGQYDNRGPRTGSVRTDQNIRTAMEWAEGR